MRICVFTCSRSEYSLLYPVMREINESKFLNLQIVVTGTHLLPEFGKSKDVILNDGFKIDAEIEVPPYKDDLHYQVEVASRIMLEMGNILKNLETDILLVLGDRFEVLAAVYSAFLLNIPIAHIHGGDLSGNIDNSIRFAISRLSHIHLCATEQSAKRLKKIGEEDWRIHVVGSPSIDNALNIPEDKEEIKKKYGIHLDKEYILVLLHPETGGKNKEIIEKAITTVINVIEELKYETVFIYPNYDFGSSTITKELENLKEKEWIHIIKNVPHSDYINLLRSCFILLGNSSSGIIEASAIKIPVINLGKRQANRERAGNVIDLPFDFEQIVKKIRELKNDKGLYNKYSNTKNIYGDGNAAKKIRDILENIQIEEKLLKKEIKL